MTISVLYVEDDADIRMLTEMALEDEDIYLHSFSNGPDAILAAKNITVDAILLDVMMPEMDGPTTLSRLRQIPHLLETPAIYMTAKVKEYNRQHCSDAKVVGTIEKPFSAVTLAEDIRRLYLKANS